VLEPVVTNHQEPPVRESTWTQVPATPVLDPDLTAKAKGLYVVLTALVEQGHRLTVAKIAEYFADGEAAIKSGLTELESFRYLTRELLRDERGRRSGIRYTVHPTRADAAERRTA
jgi:hypothetical protein